MKLDEIQLLIKQNKHKEAIIQIDMLLKVDEQQTRLWYWRSVCNMSLENLDVASTDLEKAIEQVPTDPDLISQMGVLRFHQKRLPEALEQMNSAQNLDPKNPYRYSSRAYILERLGRLDEAIADYEEAIRLDPDDAVAHNNLGMLQEKAGWKKKAEQHYNKADKIADGKVFEPKGKEISTDKKEKKPPSKPAEKNSNDQRKRSHIIKEVFSSKQGFREFVDFVKNFLKN